MCELERGVCVSKCILITNVYMSTLPCVDAYLYMCALCVCKRLCACVTAAQVPMLQT